MDRGGKKRLLLFSGLYPIRLSVSEDDGTFVTTTYGHWTAGEPPYVVSVRFTLAELDARGSRPTVR